MVEIRRIGSVYFDDKPVSPGSPLGRHQFAIGDTRLGKEIRWVKDGSLLVADHCVCTDVSWEQLNQMGLVYGTKVIIDGKTFLCRCLTAGRSMADPNEWDTCLASMAATTTSGIGWASISGVRRSCMERDRAV